MAGAVPPAPKPVMNAAIATPVPQSGLSDDPPAPARRAAGGFSIKQFTAKAAPNTTLATEDATVATEPAASADSAPLMPISEALLRRVWKEYAVRKKRDGRDSLHATLVAREPALKGPRVIAFAIVNEVQEKYLRDERPELLAHLRRELGDPGLDLAIEKQEVADLRPRYTPKDRFAIMVERNPALLKLKEELGLDLG